MEDIAILGVIGAVALAEAIGLFFADLVGLFMGLGWRHYSKRRAAAKRLKKEATTND